MGRLTVFFLVPGSLETRTGGSIYDRRMTESLRARGWSVDVRELDGDFPHPSASALEQAARVFAAIPDRMTVVVDGLALGAMPAEVEREATRLRFVALVHLPLALEAGIDAGTAARLKASEQRALAAVRAVIVTGASTVRALEECGVSRDRIAVIEPGTDAAPVARGSGHPSRPHLVSVATLNPGKGHDLLVEALANVPHRDWRLTCAGSFDRHPPTVDRLRSLIRSKNLEDHVSLVGDLDTPTLNELYDCADVFVLATRHETYGMAVAEALARGLPVVSTTTGAIPDLVGDAAGLLVPPDDVDALTEALSSVIGDPAVRTRLAAGARRVRERIPTWDAAAAKLIAALDAVEAR